MKMTPDILEAEGWKSNNAGGFTGAVGPYWYRGEGEDLSVGLIVEERHSNNHLNTIHGGVVMTFADIALGSGAVLHLGEKRFGTVTASLQTQFLATAQIGDFITCRPEVVKKTRHLIFVRGLIKAGDKNIASVEGIWKILDPSAKTPSP